MLHVKTTSTCSSLERARQGYLFESRQSRMKVRFWPHTRRSSIASYRIRCSAIVNGLRDRGVDAAVISRPEPADVVVLSKRYDDESLDACLRLRADTGTRLILDLCDNHFYSSTDDVSAARQAFSLRRTLEAVDGVIASSAILASQLACSARIRGSLNVIEDVIEEPIIPPLMKRIWQPRSETRLLRLDNWLSRQATMRNMRLVWFGNAGDNVRKGGMESLLKIQYVLESLSQRYPLSLTIISNSRQKFLEICSAWRVPVFYLPWSLHTVSRALCLHGISVIPIEQNPFTQAKTANRVTASIMHGLAVVADHIPSYEPYADMIFLNDWSTSLEALLSDAKFWEARVRMARQRLQPDVHNEQIFHKWSAILESFAISTK